MAINMEDRNFYYTVGDEEGPWYEKYSDPQHCFNNLPAARQELSFLKKEKGFESLSNCWSVRTNSRKILIPNYVKERP